jgi:hypothetical protein
MGSVGARWQRVTQTLRVSPTGGGGGGGARWSTLAIHTPSGDSAYTPTAPPKSRLTWRRLLTGAILGSIIGGGAYVGTSDEATIRFGSQTIVIPGVLAFFPSLTVSYGILYLLLFAVQ